VARALSVEYGEIVASLVSRSIGPGTFLLHAKRAADRFDIPARDIPVEPGRKKMIAGQEDLITDTALTLAKERGQETRAVA
jgi:acetaldehyde dehydrogenase (acetylating)